MVEKWVFEGDNFSDCVVFTVQLDNTVIVHVETLRQILDALGYQPVDTAE